MTTVTVDDEVQARFQAVAAPDEDLDSFMAAAAKDALKRREREAAARAEAQAILNGPRRSFAESDADFRRRHNIPDLSHLSREELEDQGDAILAALPPEKIAEAERLGLI